MSDSRTPISEDTKELLKKLSRGMLLLHKSLLNQSKADYEARNGKIRNVNLYFQLVIDDPHFAWLRKLSSLVALIDEAVSVRRPASEHEAQALILETKTILDFKDEEATFNDQFQSALALNKEAVLIYNNLIGYFEENR